MAIKHYHSHIYKGVPPSELGGKREITMEEFKEWLMRFDRDKDGRIGEEDLREAIHFAGGWFCRWKSMIGLWVADKNGSGFIEENEIQNLAKLAEKQLGVRINASN